MGRILGEAKRRSKMAVMYALLTGLLFSFPVLGCASSPSGSAYIDVVTTCDGEPEIRAGAKIEFGE
jgi:hypothetical protein